MPVEVAGTVPIEDVDFKAVCDTLLELCQVAHLEWSVVFADDELVTQLNQTYRNKQGTTDVLSFPQDDPLLGDVVISVPQADRQRPGSLKDELLILLIHGLLHLLGHDHHSMSDAQKMGAEERRLADELGVAAQSLVSRAYAS